MVRLKEYAYLASWFIAMGVLIQILRMTGITFTITELLDWALLLFLLVLLVGAIYLSIEHYMEKWQQRFSNDVVEARDVVISTAEQTKEEIAMLKDDIQKENEKRLGQYLHDWFNGVHNGGFFDDLDTLFEGVNKLLTSRGEQPMRRATLTVSQSRERRKGQKASEGNIPFKQPLPPVPDHMVRVRREPTESGRDHKLISKEKFDTNPGMYELYDTPPGDEPSS